MSLPNGGPWPPLPCEVTSTLSIWSAWYGGDPDELSSVYGASSGAGSLSSQQFFGSQTGRTPANRPSTYRGGLVGAAARLFWGRPIPAGEKRAKLHVPVAGDICSTSADLLFSEPPTLRVEDVRAQDRLDELVDDGLHATLLEAAEIAAALGGVYLRAVWDAEISDRPWISAVHADCAVPEWTWGKLSAVTFYRVLAEDEKTVIRHLERHEPGVILHGLYAGDRDTLGRRIPLTDHPVTEGLARVLGPEGDAIETGLDRLTVVYIPNMRPNRMWRTLPEAAHLGRSDLSGVEPLMDALDETYTSWMRDLRLGKARIIVPDAYLESAGRGQGASFDADREVYSSLNMLPRTDGGTAITPSQFAIRVTEHQETARDLLTQILRSAGYSTQTFGLSGETAATATEIKARERRSMITRDRKVCYWRPALAEILETLLAIDTAVFGTGVTPVRPDLEFGDSVSEDPKALAETADILRRAEAASTDTLVRLVNPDWDDEQVEQEVARIRDDAGSSFGDPAMALPLAAMTDEASGADQP